EAAAGDLHRRGEGPALPPQGLRGEHHPPRRQVDQHPPRQRRRRRRDRCQGGGLRAVAHRAVVRGDAREHGGEGQLRVPGPGLLQDAAADGSVGRLLLPSFGVVLLVVLCARPVIDQSLDRGQINIAEWAVRMRGEAGGLDKIADPRIAGEADEESLRKFAESAEKCLADCCVDRPSMGDVLWNLEYCLQLQEANVAGDELENSDAVATQLPEDVVVSLLMDGAEENGLSMPEVDDSKAFSQLSARGQGR
uniref:Uncharacterized protein n=1 Tax=Aegilops tauschii subsp. strangulata TaxID=200361 RepID=A0A453J9H5_AEGTS